MIRTEQMENKITQLPSKALNHPNKIAKPEEMTELRFIGLKFEPSDIHCQFHETMLAEPDRGGYDYSSIYCCICHPI